MTASFFEDTLQAELALIEAPFGPVKAEEAANGNMRIGAVVRGLRVRLEVDPTEYPGQPPLLYVEQRGVVHPLRGEDGRITELRSLREWNRTLGLISVLQELQLVFTDQPPLVRSHMVEWLHRLLARLRP